MTESPTPNMPEYFAGNYCISFIDLLGQRDAFHGQGLLPTTNAYELESEVAQYPRIIVSQRVVEFLEAHRATTGADPFTRVNREYAKLCLDMLVQDIDGHLIVHYLGDAFQFSVTSANHRFFHDKARAFVVDQLEEHRKSKNGKLAFRYSQLLNYFDVHPYST